MEFYIRLNFNFLYFEPFEKEQLRIHEFKILLLTKLSQIVNSKKKYTCTKKLLKESKIKNQSKDFFVLFCKINCQVARFL